MHMVPETDGEDEALQIPPLSSLRGMVRGDKEVLLLLLTPAKQSVSHKASSSCHTQPKRYVDAI